MPTINILAENVIAIRAKLKLSQEEFGKLISATKAQIYYIESGTTTKPKKLFLDAIAAIAKVSVEDLKTKRLNLKDIKPEINDNVFSNLLKMLAFVRAQNSRILYNQTVIVAGSASGKKFIITKKDNDKAVEEEMQKLLSSKMSF